MQSKIVVYTNGKFEKKVLILDMRLFERNRNLMDEGSRKAALEEIGRFAKRLEMLKEYFIK